jgi:hypothetical protein
MVRLPFELVYSSWHVGSAVIVYATQKIWAYVQPILMPNLECVQLQFELCQPIKIAYQLETTIRLVFLIASDLSNRNSAHFFIIQIRSSTCI